MDAQIIEYGPCRALGVRYTGKNEKNEIPAVWDNELLPRMGEIGKPAGPQAAFGICRCLPGVTDGSFEYVAAFEAGASAPRPAGMVEVQIPECSYAVFPVDSLEVIKTVWQSLPRWLEAHPEWEPYCGPAGCECATHPSFEYYPPDFSGGSLFVYMPVRAKRP